MELRNNSNYRVQEFIVAGMNDASHPLLIGIAILFILMLIVLGSVTNIVVILLNRPLHKPMYFFISCLAVVDVIYTWSMGVTLLDALLRGNRVVPYEACLTQHFLFHLGSFMEPMTIALMAYDRLIAISLPLRYHSILTKTHAFLLIFFNCLLGGALSGAFTGLVANLPFCDSNELPYTFCDFPSLVRTACVNPKFYFTVASSVLSIVQWLSFSFICLSYIKIIYEVVNMSSSADKKKVFSTCVNHLVVVVCYFIPKFVLVAITRLGLVLTLTQRNGLMIGSTLGPSLINPFVYSLKTKEIRNQIKSIVKFKISPKI